MGFNGSFLLVRGDRDDVRARLPGETERFFSRAGLTLVDRSPCTDDSLLGIAIAPPVAGWIAIADSERSPSDDLARVLANVLATPVVISSIYEICDPPEPEVVTVFGAEPDPRFRGLYELVGFRYRDLVQPFESFYPEPPFDPTAVVFLTFRDPKARGHDRCARTNDDDVGF